MPLFNLFKKKEGEPQRLKESVKEPVKERVKESVKEPMKESVKEPVKDASGIILRSHVSEKASSLQQNNEYVFEVFSSATKLMVRDALERTYGVNAQKVRIINVKPRKVRVGKFQGTKPGFKKAIVGLRKGEKIDSLSA